MKIPDVKGVARSVPAVQTQLVRSDPYEGLGEALQGLGGAAAREVDERASYQTAQARSAFIKARIERDSAFEEDREYTDLPERYEQSLRTDLSEVSKQISNPRARAMFEEEQQVRIAEGKARQSTRAIGIERDTERARVSDSLNALNEAGLGTEDPREMFAEVGALLEGAVEAGYYSPEEAGRTERVWKDTFAANKISLMEPDKRIEALEQPWAENIPTVVREKLREKAERDGRSARAIDMSEQFWSDTDGDFNAALKLAAKVKDTDDRLAIEGRLTTINSRESAARVDLESDAADRAWAVLADGGVKDDIDPADLDALGGRAKIAIDNWERSRINADQSRIDAASEAAFDMIEAVHEIDPALYMQGPEAWPEQLGGMYAALTPTDQQRLAQNLLSRSREEETAPEIRTNFNAVKSDMGLTAMELFPSDADDVRTEIGRKGDHKKRLLLEGIVLRRTREWTAENGGQPITESDRRQIIKMSFNEFDSKKFEVVSGDIFRGMRGAGAKAAQVRDALREQIGREPTDAEIESNLMRMMESE